MAINRGYGLTLGIGVESTWGTAVARTNWIRLNSCSIQRKITRVPKPDLGTYGATSSNRRSSFVEKDEVSGDIEFIVAYDDSSLLLLQHALGAVATSGASSPYTHAITLATVLPTGLTLEVIRGTGTSTAEVFEGCKITSGSISVSAGGIMTCRLSVIGETSQGYATAGTPTYSSNGNPVLHHHSAATLSFNSVNYAYESLELTWDNRLAFRQDMGSKLTAEPLPTDQIETKLRVQRKWDNAAPHAALLADTQSDVAVVFTGTGVNALTVTLHNALLEDVSVPINSAGPVTETLAFVGYSDGVDEGIKLSFVNANSAAADN